MAEAHFTHIENVIDTLSRHKAELQEMLALSPEKFGLAEYLVANSILKRGEQIGTITPDDEVAKNMNRAQLNKLIELVDRIVNLESEISVVDAELVLKVKAFANTI